MAAMDQAERERRQIVQQGRLAFGNILGDLRRAAELKQDEFGERLGVGFTAVSAYESGRIELPPHQWEKWAEICGVDSVDLSMCALAHYSPYAYFAVKPENKAFRDALMNGTIRFNDFKWSIRKAKK